jgi:hypothetical protein
MTTLAEKVRAELAQADPYRALKVALDAASRAAEEALPGTRGRPAAERFAVALRVATETLSRLALEMAGDQGGGLD